MENQAQEEVVVDGNGEPVPQNLDAQTQQTEPTQQQAQPQQADQPPAWFQEYVRQQNEKLSGYDRSLGQVKGLQGKFDQLIAQISRPSQTQQPDTRLSKYDPAQLSEAEALIEAVVGKKFGDKFQAVEGLRQQAEYQSNSMKAQNTFMSLAGNQAKELEPIAVEIAREWQEKGAQGDQGAIAMVQLFTSNPEAAARVLLSDAKARYSETLQAKGNEATEALKAKGNAASPIPAKGKAQVEPGIEAILSMPDGPEKTAKLGELLKAKGGIKAAFGMV